MKSYFELMGSQKMKNLEERFCAIERKFCQDSAKIVNKCKYLVRENEDQAFKAEMKKIDALREYSERVVSSLLDGEEDLIEARKISLKIFADTQKMEAEYQYNR